MIWAGIWNRSEVEDWGRSEVEDRSSESIPRIW
jgi:hypothetical protein